MTRGMIKAEKTSRKGQKTNGTKKSGKNVVGTLGKVLGIGLAAGIALIAATDKTMSKAFPQEESEDNKEEKEGIEEE